MKFLITDNNEHFEKVKLTFISCLFNTNYRPPPKLYIGFWRFIIALASFSVSHK